jgi:hypothetical protein
MTSSSAAIPKKIPAGGWRSLKVTQMVAFNGTFATLRSLP